MKRIEKALKILSPKYIKSWIVDNVCPYDIDKGLEDLDVDTYTMSDSNNVRGCRGITCEECWEKEL